VLLNLNGGDSFIGFTISCENVENKAERKKPQGEKG
jgi:hypothetical protein